MPSQEKEELERAIHERIEIRAYDPTWPSQFEAESRRLRTLCGGKLLAIEHVGSTAVTGLSAKPIIDILATVQSIQLADEVLAFLCENGYTTSAEFNAALGDEHWMMRQEKGHRTHHLHLVLPMSEVWSNKIRFRDLLRRDENLRQNYVELKANLANTLSENREAYTDAKTEFVRRALADEK